MSAGRYFNCSCTPATVSDGRFKRLFLLLLLSKNSLEMPNCSFRKCHNNTKNTNKNSGVTFHSFPQDPSIKEKWIKIIQDEQRDECWLPTQFSRVCSSHFASEDFYFTPKGRRRIKTRSIPSFQFTSPQTASEEDVTMKNMESIQSSSRTTSPSENLEPENLVQVVMVDDDSNADDTRSGSPIPEDLVSDTDSIFDTPIVATLKAQLKASLENNKKYSYRINALQRRSKYYKKKTVTLRAVVKQLRSKIEIFKKIITKLSENAKKANKSM